LQSGVVNTYTCTRSFTMRLPSTRNAFLIHFAISLVVFALLCLIMTRVWYPGALFSIDGGIQGLKILAPIDLILGPALTLLFYRPWKKSVRFDMCFIAVAQIAALSFGIYNVYQQRPVALVYAQTRFETVSHATHKAANEELAQADIDATPLSRFGTQRPAVIYAEGFKTFTEQGEYLTSLLNNMPELRERSDRYLPLDQGKTDILNNLQAAAASQPSTAEEVSPQDGQEETAATENGTRIEVPASYDQLNDAYHRIPLKGRYGEGLVLLNVSDFRFAGVRARRIAD